MFLRKQFESSSFVMKLNGRDSAVFFRINAVIRSVSLPLVFEHLNNIELFLQIFLKCSVCKQEKHFAFCARHCPNKCASTHLKHEREDIYRSLLSCRLLSFPEKYAIVDQFFDLLGNLSGSTRLACESNRKAMNRNWSNQKSNPALKTKAGNK